MKLSDYLAERRMTQKAFADKVGVDVSSVTRWALGTRRPRLVMLARIREVTGGAVTADDFIGSMDEEPEHRPAA